MTRLDGGHIDELAALLAVGAEGSFVAAGRSLERHPTIVSKRIVALETRLGVRLVERTTRQVRLTEAGARLVEKLRAAASLLEDAQQEATNDAHELNGRLRLALPASMGRMWLAPLLPEFMARHPKLRVEVNYSDAFVDLVEGGFDAAIRVGFLNDSGLVARKLADHQRVLSASPTYLDRHGVPQAPADLEAHNCLEYPGLFSFPVWRMSDGRRTESVRIRGTMRANDTVALLEAARAGVGILGAGEWLSIRDIADGALVRVLPSWTFDAEGGIYLVRPSARFAPARTEAFVAWITEVFRRSIPWGRSAQRG